jgi:hypothetical protein
MFDYQAFKSKIKDEEAESILSTEKRPLWAIAVNEWNRQLQRFELVIRYSHADTMAEAKMTYIRARCDAYGRVLTPYVIIGVAQTIGMKALDDNGTRLVA